MIRRYRRNRVAHKIVLGGMTPVKLGPLAFLGHEVLRACRATRGIVETTL